MEPTLEPTAQPSPSPTAVPTALPTPLPSDRPTQQPTVSPTRQPTDFPTTTPPSAHPTFTPNPPKIGLIGEYRPATFDTNPLPLSSASSSSSSSSAALNDQRTQSPTIACYLLTQSGEKCAFPFVYNKVRYARCVADKVGEAPWCATQMRDDGKSFDWGICSDKWSCTGSEPLAAIATPAPSGAPSVTPSAQIVTVPTGGTSLASDEALSHSVTAAASAVEVAKVAGDAARDATEAADTTATVKQAYERGVHSKSSVRAADKQVKQAMHTIHQLDMMAKTAMKDARRSASTDEGTMALGYMSSAQGAAALARVSVDAASQDMDKVKKVTKADPALGATEASDAEDVEAIHLMTDADADAVSAAQDATSAASKADAANHAMGQVANSDAEATAKQ